VFCICSWYIVVVVCFSAFISVYICFSSLFYCIFAYFWRINVFISDAWYVVVARVWRLKRSCRAAVDDLQHAVGTNWTPSSRARRTVCLDDGWTSTRVDVASSVWRTVVLSTRSTSASNSTNCPRCLSTRASSEFTRRQAKQTFRHQTSQTPRNNPAWRYPREMIRPWRKFDNCH